METRYSLSHAACLAAQLPRSSRCMEKLSGSRGWTDNTVLMSLIEYDIRSFASSFAEDPPEPRPPFQYEDLHQPRENGEVECRSMVDSVLGVTKESITNE